MGVERAAPTARDVCANRTSLQSANLRKEGRKRRLLRTGPAPVTSPPARLSPPTDPSMRGPGSFRETFKDSDLESV